jgi:hypothetical protein
MIFSWASTPERILVLTSLVAVCGGCELVDKARDAVVEDHRAEARGRVGVFRALETKDRAVAVALSVRDYADPACALPTAPFAATVELYGSATVPGGVHRVRDVREISVLASGDVQVRYRIEWEDAAGRGDTWTRIDTVIGSQHYVQEQNLPAVAHTRRPGTARRVLRKGLDGVRTGLHAGRGRWEGAGPPPPPEPPKPKATPPDAGNTAQDADVAATSPRTVLAAPVHEPAPQDAEHWILARSEGHSFRGCLEPSERGWLTDLSATAELDKARVALSPGDRRFRGAWTLEDDRRLTVDIRERIRDAPQPFATPDRVEDVKRDRPYRDIERILGDRLGLSDWKP